MRRQSTDVDSDRPNLGGQEIALLRFLEERQPVSLREVAGEFGEGNGLARTTVHTMLERLRKKKVLNRSKKDGVFVYRLAGNQGDMLQGIVGAFVEKTLGGSVIPFVAYLAQSKSLKRDELEALAKFVEEMRREEEAQDVP